MTRRYVYLALGVLAVAMLLRVTWVLASPEYIPCCDASDYDRYAASIASGDGYPPFILSPADGPTAFRLPVVPGLLAGVYRATGADDTTDRWKVGRLSQAVVGSIAVALIGLFAGILFRSATIGSVAAAIAAVYPPLVIYSTSLLTEPVFLCLEVGALTCVLVFRRSTRFHVIWVSIAGVLAGLAVLTRPNGLILLPPLALAVLPQRLSMSLRALTHPMLLVAVAGAVLAPWIIRNHVAFGSLVLHTQTGFTIAGTYSEESRRDPQFRGNWRFPSDRIRQLAEDRVGELEMDAVLRRAGLTYAKRHPMYVLEVSLRNTYRMLDLSPRFSRFIYSLDTRTGSRTADIARWAFYAVAILGAAGYLLRRSDSLPAFVWLTPLLFFASTVWFWGANRYRQPIEPFLIAFAAVAIVRSIERLDPKRVG